MSPSLKKYVIEKMEDEWSPELIAGRLKNEEKDPVAVSAKAIYKFVYSVHGRKIEKLLYSKKHAHKGPKRGSRKPSLDGRTMIDKRPASIDSREEFGHFEGDFIESGRDGKGSLLHLVERKTRYSFLVKVEDRKTIAVNALIAKTLSGVDPLSLTLDNDLSFAKHVALSELLKTSVYFCHAYHSWEKGTVENRNKAVRKDFPKRTDFSLISESAVKETETKLRTRPLKILGFKTPQEAWEKEMLIRASLKVASKTDQDIISTLSTFINIECSD